MKAIEYYNKYHDALLSSDNQGISDMCFELMHETEAVIKQRKCRTDSAARAVIKEHNQKFNAINSLFKKKDGIELLRRDGYILLWCEQLPALKPYLCPSASVLA